ncbi:hypothetical protein BMF94_2161 [Rhodotorula taiwanensis]|uniref:GPI transamidase component PIG-S n=1 Tax=Rhodotorula taiwanensis TaxID=741276 RepID=A0A2S5BDQ4_9BASI|nr:hypothetical protein BMF94_2161 [Rhodotorula taiwanensis]
MADTVKGPEPLTRVPEGPTPVAVPDDPSSRMTILASIWAIALLLGVPLWWRTTALERRTLPESRIQTWEANYRDRIPFLDRLSGKSLFKGLLPSAVTITDLSRPEDPTDGSAAAKFSRQYKLAFTLLNEDSTLGNAVLGWDAPALLQNSVVPLLDSLAPLHNFTVETQVQYFAPLAIEVHRADGQEGTYVDEADLRAFVNNAEWNLATGDTLDPVLQFLLFVPSAEHRPLRIRKHDGHYAPPAFISPQRGGVVIYNPPAPAHEQPPSIPLDLPTAALLPSFRTFERQLRTLLDVSVLVSSTSPIGARLSPAEVDAVALRRLRKAADDTVETLAATVRLASEIQNMRINGDVQQRVSAALDQLDEAASSDSVLVALSHVAAAQSLASRAYFDPSMMGMLYFPDEHKYAVYTPLFGPVAVPLVLALLKELKQRRYERKRGKKRPAGGTAGADEAEPPQPKLA